MPTCATTFQVLSKNRLAQSGGTQPVFPGKCGRKVGKKCGNMETTFFTKKGTESDTQVCQTVPLPFLRTIQEQNFPGLVALGDPGRKPIFHLEDLMPKIAHCNQCVKTGLRWVAKFGPKTPNPAQNPGNAFYKTKWHTHTRFRFPYLLCPTINFPGNLRCTAKRPIGKKVTEIHPLVTAVAREKTGKLSKQGLW